MPTVSLKTDSAPVCQVIDLQVSQDKVACPGIRGLSRKKWCAAAADFLCPARRRRRRRDFAGAPPTHSSVIEFLIGKT
jgi:hypothetical protein